MVGEAFGLPLPGVAGRKNGGTSTPARPRINFIEGTNITLSVVDDAVGDEVDVTIGASAGGSSPTAPAWIEHLAEDALATSLDEFDDSSFTGWTTVTIAGSQTIAEGRDVLSVSPTAAIPLTAGNCIVKASALSIGQAVEIHVRGAMVDDADQLTFGPVITDGTTSAANAAANMAQRFTTSPLLWVYPYYGTLGSLTQGTGLGQNVISNDVYLRLEYDAANTFIPWVSIDGVIWHAFPTITRTMTPSHVGFGWNTNNTAPTYMSVAIDYVRVVTV